MRGGQQRVGFMRGIEPLFIDRMAELQIVNQRQVEAAAVQAMHQLMLFAVVQMQGDFRIAFLKPGHQLRHIQRGHRFKATDGDHARNQLFIRSRILFELPGQAQQLFRFIVDPPTAGGERNALRVVANKQLLVEGALQILDGNRNRRLRNVQLAGGLGDTLRLHHGDEIFELLQGKSVHSITIDKIWSGARGE